MPLIGVGGRVGGGSGGAIGPNFAITWCTFNADRQGTAALLESAVTRLSGATVSSSVGSNFIAARGNRALTLNAILTVVFLPLRNISDLDSDRFALRQAAAARDDHAQVMEELELVVREHLARLPTRREQAFTPFG